MFDNVCVVCGAVLPEGVQVCSYHITESNTKQDIKNFNTSNQKNIRGILEILLRCL